MSECFSYSPGTKLTSVTPTFVALHTNLLSVFSRHNPVGGKTEKYGKPEVSIWFGRGIFQYAKHNMEKWRQRSKNPGSNTYWEPYILENSYWTRCERNSSGLLRDPLIPTNVMLKDCRLVNRYWLRNWIYIPVIQL